MTELLILRGLPASGKSSFAKRWVILDQDNRVRVNRDDLRILLHTEATYKWPQEEAVTAAEHAMIDALLRAGKSVVVDNTNLRSKYVRQYMEIAHRNSAEIRVQDFEAPVDELVQRDLLRASRGERSVGEEVIRTFASRFLQGGKLPPVPELDEETGGEPYVPDTSKPCALQIDIDGTVALHNDRSPYDYSRVLEDLPNENVISLIQDAWASEKYDRLIFLSGRPETCRTDTAKWLARYFDPDEFDLFMRTEGDQRNDAVIKVELFDKYVRHNYNVVAVLDDRNRVVRAWRNLGLTCLQVADGAF